MALKKKMKYDMFVNLQHTPHTRAHTRTHTHTHTHTHAHTHTHTPAIFWLLGGFRMSESITFPTPYLELEWDTTHTTTHTLRTLLSDLPCRTYIATMYIQYTSAHNRCTYILYYIRKEQRSIHALCTTHTHIFFPPKSSHLVSQYCSTFISTNSIQ